MGSNGHLFACERIHLPGGYCWALLEISVVLLSVAAAAGQEYVFIGGAEWQPPLTEGRVVAVPPDAWAQYMDTWEQYGVGEPYPDNEFVPCTPPTGGLYVWEGGGGPAYPESPGLVMYWDVPPAQPGSFSSAYYYVLVQEPPGASLQPPQAVNLSNALLSVMVTAPQFDFNGNQINAVSLGLQDAAGFFRSWSWTVGLGPQWPIQWNVPTQITINLAQTSFGAAVPTATGFAETPGFQISQCVYVIADENGARVGGGTPIPPPGLFGGIWNYWHNLSIAPLSGGGGGGPPSDHGPVSFSVNGWMQGTPGFDGLPVPGSPLFNPPWAPPPPPGLGPYGFMRQPGTLAALGLPTARIGDVSDYAVLWGMTAPSEAEIFQSEPDLNPAGAPNRSNNQVVQAAALGLQHLSANLDAYSFGEDYFSGDESPIEGAGAQEGRADLWVQRMGVPGFEEPFVAHSGAPIVFYFSVDPYAVGMPNTALRNEATAQGVLTLPAGPLGSADAGAGVGPWQSAGEAAGDVFFASPLTAPGINFLDHDDAAMALLAPRTANAEDDLDALEHVGLNSAGEAGNTHDRVVPTSGFNGGFHPPDLGDPTNPNHDPVAFHPLIFSVDRGSYGAPGSAVATQVGLPNEGAGGDLFIAVTLNFGPFVGTTTNMLLVDEGQLGLMPHDELDAVIVDLRIDPAELAFRIEDAVQFYSDDPAGSIGPGFTLPLLQEGEAVIGFSVDISTIGLLRTAVDFECRVDGAALVGPNYAGSGVVEQAGDVFFANLKPKAGQMAADAGTGLLYGQNYLWFEETALGLDRGSWTLVQPPGPSGQLQDAPDDLNALDSLDEFVEPLEEPCCLGDGQCVEIPPDDCLAQGGLPLGADTACEAPQACCLPSGACQLVDGRCCPWIGGAFPPSPPAMCLGDPSGDGVDDVCQALDQVVCEPQGGLNPAHPPTYWYDLTPDPTFGICDFHVRVFDDDPTHYSFAVPPAGWLFTVHRPDGINAWASWWNPGCTNALFAPATFRFQFNHDGAAAWGQWRTTFAGTSNPDAAEIKDRSEHHAGQPDGSGARVHGPQCVGELDGTPPVNAADLAQLLGAWGPNLGHPADLNGDGVVNAADLARLLGNWNCD